MTWTCCGTARWAPCSEGSALRPPGDVLAFPGIDSMQKRVYGHAKQGARLSHMKIQGKTVLVRGLRVHRHDRGADGLGVLRGADDRRDPPGRRPVLGHRPDERQGEGRDRRDRRGAWTPVRYPRAIWDDQLRAWISDAEIAETTYTAFARDRARRSPPG
jgi:hypothetical protein